MTRFIVVGLILMALFVSSGAQPHKKAESMTSAFLLSLLNKYDNPQSRDMGRQYLLGLGDGLIWGLGVSRRLCVPGAPDPDEPSGEDFYEVLFRSKFLDFKQSKTRTLTQAQLGETAPAAYLTIALEEFYPCK